MGCSQEELTVQRSNTVCGICNWLIGGEGWGPQKEGQVFGKEEETDVVQDAFPALGSSHQGLICAQLWGPGSGFHYRGPRLSPHSPLGGLLWFSVFSFFSHVSFP